jgi:hypothetical protein
MIFLLTDSRQFVLRELGLIRCGELFDHSLEVLLGFENVLCFCRALEVGRLPGPQSIGFVPLPEFSRCTSLTRLELRAVVVGEFPSGGSWQVFLR